MRKFEVIEAVNMNEVNFWENLLALEGLAPIDTQWSEVLLVNNRRAKDEIALHNAIQSYKPRFTVKQGLDIVAQVKSEFNYATYKRRHNDKNWFERIKKEAEEEAFLPF